MTLAWPSAPCSPPIVLTPLWLQSDMGYTATWAGYVTGLERHVWR